MSASLEHITSTFSFLGKHLLATCRVPWTVNLGFCPTHVFLNRQARLILEADGHIMVSSLLKAFHRELDFGVCWADSGWGSLHHFYHARSGSGLFGVAGADVFVQRFYKRALRLWCRGESGKAMFFLGAVTHLVQDICEPHHSNCSLGIGHHNYERWVQERKEYYPAYSGGIYKKHRDPAQYLKECAGESYGFFDLVDKKAAAHYYHQATEYLLPLTQTQRVTAGLWLNFLEQAGVALDTQIGSGHGIIGSKVS